jgi:hypothetical protein
MAAILKVQLIGAEEDNRDVRFSDFIFQCQAIKNALRESEAFFCGDGKEPLDYRITGLRHDSPSTLELNPIAGNRTQDYVRKVLKGFATELHRIRRDRRLLGRPEMGRLRAYSEIGKRPKGHVEEVRIAVEETHTIRKPKPVQVAVDRRFKQNLEEILGPDEIVYGSISGRLDWLNFHDARRFRLYPIVGPQRITGEFGEEIRDQVRNGADRFVTVFGRLHYKTWDKYPHHVRATKVETHDRDEDLPSLNDIKGIAPQMTGELSSVDWVRKIRDEEW